MLTYYILGIVTGIAGTCIVIALAIEGIILTEDIDDADVERRE